MWPHASVLKFYLICLRLYEVHSQFLVKSSPFSILWWNSGMIDLKIKTTLLNWAHLFWLLRNLLWFWVQFVLLFVALSVSFFYTFVPLTADFLLLRSLLQVKKISLLIWKYEMQKFWSWVLMDYPVENCLLVCFSGDKFTIHTGGCSEEVLSSRFLWWCISSV